MPHFDHFLRPREIDPYMSFVAILLAASNEAKAKTSDKRGDIVAQLPLGRHEEGVKEGPSAIPALEIMIMMMVVVVSSLCL